MIAIERVSKRFHNRLVLDGVSFEVPDAKVVVILGPSGIGKTVLLKIMAGLMAPDQGLVSYDGTAFGYGTFSDNRPVYAQLGYVFQGGALFDSLSVADNVALPLRENTGLREREVRERAAAVLERVGMGQHARLLPRALSGGMTRLVAIARALASSPRYLFFDEPTTGLDPVMRGRISDLISSLRDQEGKTEVVVTHDLDAARAVADRILMLKDGRLSSLEGARKEDYEAQYA